MHTYLEWRYELRDAYQQVEEVEEELKLIVEHARHKCNDIVLLIPDDVRSVLVRISYPIQEDYSFRVLATVASTPVP